MKKWLSLALMLVMLLAVMAPVVYAEETTDVGTPRAQTLICEPDADVNPNPGQFNPYMSGTQASWGMHQIMWADGLWEVNTMTGETIPTIAAELATPNEDYTQWTIKIRPDLKWSDGEALDANDVAFTFNMIMNTPDIGDSSYYNSLFEGIEVVDDLTLVVTCKAPFTRIMTTLGVNTWGCGFRTVPEHIYKDVDVMTFPDNAPLAADAYKMVQYDELGTWILYQKREDWANTPTGILYGEPKPEYVLYRVFGNAEARVMAALNNEVDVMNEVSYEDLQLILDGNDAFSAWYNDFPYANTDDACSKGVWFNTGIEPFNNVDVRWALTLCCNWFEVTENIFEGIGRMSAMNCPAVTAQVNNYYKPMNDWLSNEFTIVDGYNPWNPNFAVELRDVLVEDYGYNLADLTEDECITMFGTGYWKTDVEKATEILQGIEGFELKDGKWYWQGEPWTIEVHTHPEEASTQAARSAKAIADQWMKFGITVNVTTLSNSDVGTRANLGDFQVNDNWSTCASYVKDFYNNVTGWDSELYTYPIGEQASGMGAYRLGISNPELAAEITEIVRSAEMLDPQGDEIQAVMTEFLKKTTEAHISIDVHAGTKIVPMNTKYWTNFPSAENPYEGPWWWWSNFRFTVAQLTPAE